MEYHPKLRPKKIQVELGWISIFLPTCLGKLHDSAKYLATSCVAKAPCGVKARREEGGAADGLAGNRARVPTGSDPFFR